MKRICIDARFYRKATAGVGRYTRGLIHHLQPLDTENEYTVILTPADYAEWPKEDTPKNWHVEVMDLPIYSVAEQTKLLAYLNKQKFDLVHFTMFNHPILYRGNFVTTIHDLTMTLFPLKANWHPKMQAYLATMRHAAHGAKHILVPSEYTKQDLKKHLGVAPKKVTVTLEAVEPNFVPVTDEKELARLKAKYKITKPFFFFLSAWRPHKGLPELVAAFQELKQTHDAQLLIGGKPDTDNPAVSQAVRDAQQTNTDILTPGFVADEDIPGLYSLALAFVCPSHYEGFGLPPLEAMSCGCPVISAHNSSLPEVIDNAGVFFETGNSHDLATKMAELLNDNEKRQALSSNGLARAKTFSFDKMAQETLAVYQQILK